MKNIPTVNLGIVAVSRDCFPADFSASRRNKVTSKCSDIGLNIYEAKCVVENDADTVKALKELKDNNVNALVVYLGNFGPEGPETLLARNFDGPVMLAAAAEESQDNLFNGRGDAYCGMLNASYSIGLRNLKVYIPEYPVGVPSEIAAMIKDFEKIAGIVLGLRKLKIFSFGPRPQDFLACNAPIKPLFDLGVEIQENSELDLFASFNEHKDDKRIAEVAENMKRELGNGNKHPGILNRLAQYEITLLDWIAANRGASEFVAFANKCWPAFQTQFGFVPCYVNSRFASKGIPIACETDIYGALTEYIITCATGMPAALLDINNTVPYDMYENNKDLFKNYSNRDLFMGFHCGNTSSCHMKNYEMRYQLIMKRSLEPDTEPDITRGTLEGTIKPGDITLFRLQSTASAELKSYIAEGEVIDVDPRSFGSIGVFAVPEMGRFYRHVLIEKRFPHHAGISFIHAGKILFEAMKLLGVEDIATNNPKSVLYNKENPFA